jgi:cation transport regulator ChaB
VPYEELDDLPESVKSNLPKHAREIYRAAYNSAEEQYGEESRAQAGAAGRPREAARREPKTEGDVDEYLEALRSRIMGHIDEGRPVAL